MVFGGDSPQSPPYLVSPDHRTQFHLTFSNILRTLIWFRVKRKERFLQKLLLINFENLQRGSLDKLSDSIAILINTVFYACYIHTLHTAQQGILRIHTTCCTSMHTTYTHCMLHNNTSQQCIMQVHTTYYMGYIAQQCIVCMHTT